MDSLCRFGDRMSLPKPFDAEYRIATSKEIRTWSYGQVTKTRVPESDPFDNHIGTLNDQRIFGPTEENRCACGKCNGKNWIGMICDLCGVKITGANERRIRFGHLEFSQEISHPFSPSAKMGCFPVIPIEYLTSFSGFQLCEMYESLLVEPTSLPRLIEWLTPVASNSIQWNTVDRDMFTRGIGLAPQNAK